MDGKLKEQYSVLHYCHSMKYWITEDNEYEEDGEYWRVIEWRYTDSITMTHRS